VTDNDPPPTVRDRKCKRGGGRQATRMRRANSSHYIALGYQIRKRYPTRPRDAPIEEGLRELDVDVGVAGEIGRAEGPGAGEGQPGASAPLWYSAVPDSDDDQTFHTRGTNCGSLIADKFRMYIAAVQDPDETIAVCRHFYRSRLGGCPSTVREDFCGMMANRWRSSASSVPRPRRRPDALARPNARRRLVYRRRRTVRRTRFGDRTPRVQPRCLPSVRRWRRAPAGGR